MASSFLPFTGGMPQLPGNTWQQYANAAGGQANAAMGAAVGGAQAKKKKKQQTAMAQPGMVDLQRDLGAAGMGPQASAAASPGAGGGGFLGLHAPANFMSGYQSPGYGGFGGGSGLMSALGQALSLSGFGGGGFGGGNG